MRMKLLFVVFCSLVVQKTFAQNTITGTVSGEDNISLPGVNINIKGTSNGVYTDYDGNFTLEVEEGNVIIVRVIVM